MTLSTGGVNNSDSVSLWTKAAAAKQDVKPEDESAKVLTPQYGPHKNFADAISATFGTTSGNNCGGV